MQVEKKPVAKIGDYHIIETRHLKGGETVEVYYTIRNKAGEAVGGHFTTLKEPIDVLLDMQDEWNRKPVDVLVVARLGPGSAP